MRLAPVVLGAIVLVAASASCALPAYEIAEGGSGPGASGGSGGAGAAPSGGGGMANGGLGGGGGPAGGAGGGIPLPATPTSCDSATGVGVDATCGLEEDVDCCETIYVEGGTYYRAQAYCEDNVGFDLSATVSPFYMDKYEVTVGRFRRFLESYPTSSPPVGTGAHPLHPTSGWRSSYPFDAVDDVLADLSCNASYETWTDAAGPDDDRPINCVTWYAALLFCAWDGGRLPSEAEWNFVATGGIAQWDYPWTNFDLADHYAVYTVDGASITPIDQVGSRPDGDHATLAHSDLAGNVEEWTLDHATPDYECIEMPSPCTDCVNVSGDPERVFRGGSHADEYELKTYVRRDQAPGNRHHERGFRCVRDVP